MKFLKIKLVFFLFCMSQVLAEDLDDFEVKDRYIVGGNDAEPEQFPFLVSMRRNSDRGHMCGAAIVNTRWILTAAHCITHNAITAPDQFMNVVGTVSATSDDGDWYATLQYLLHPDWNIALVQHDVALIQTIEKIVFGPMVMPVGLSPERVNEAGTVAVISGFGQTNVLPRTDVKQFIETSLMTNPDCRRFFSRASNPFNAVRIFDSNICFINPVGKGVCGGDSGGSIVIDNVSIGIASWGVVPCGSGNPDAYARTSFYYDWIINTTMIENDDQ